MCQRSLSSKWRAAGMSAGHLFIADPGVLRRREEDHRQFHNTSDQAVDVIARVAEGNPAYTDPRDSLETMRLQLEHMNVGSKINTLSAQDTRAEMAGNLANAQQQALGAQRDLAAMVAERNGYIQSWHSEIADKLTDALSKLSDARESLNKAQLRRQLVEFRAEQDGTVMSVSKLSVGSVLKAGDQLMTVVPTDAPLEVEANIAGNDDGYVHVGDPVDIKFDTFPYSQYGLAHGVVRIVSPDSFTAQDEQRNPTGSAPVSPQQGGVFYRARITLDQIELHGTPAGFHLVPGMPITADVRVGREEELQVGAREDVRADVAAVVADGATARMQIAHDRHDRRGLAGAVAAEQANHLAVAHAERHAVQDVAVAVEGVDMVEIEHQCAMPR